MTTKAKKDEVNNTETEKSQELVASKTELDYSNIDFEALGIDEAELDGLSGIDTINPKDIMVPEAKLHSKAGRGIEVGDIELVNGDIIKGRDGEVLKGISILKIQDVRVMFPKDFKKENSFICRSLDNIFGAPDGKYAGRSCAECEFSKFPDGGGSSPCRLQKLLLCTTPDNVMFHMYVKGIGVKPFKDNFMSVEMMKGLRECKQKIKREILGALNLNLSVEIKDTDNGPFPILVFKLDPKESLVSPERYKTNIALYSSYRTFEKQAMESAGTFSDNDQSDYESQESQSGQNAQMF